MTKNYTELISTMNKLDELTAKMKYIENHAFKGGLVETYFEIFEFDRELSKDDNLINLDKMLRKDNFPGINTLFKREDIYIILKRMGSYIMITIKKYI